MIRSYLHRLDVRKSAFTSIPAADLVSATHSLRCVEVFCALAPTLPLSGATTLRATAIRTAQHQEACETVVIACQLRDGHRSFFGRDR